MKAAVQYGPFDLRVEDVPEPSCAPDEVKVKVAYCGVCGSDIEIYRGEFGLMKTPGWPKGPKTEGHEASGVIAEVGSAVRGDFAPGQRVAMNFQQACGGCYYCQNGKEHFCQEGTKASGAFAEYAVYKQGSVYRLPDSISLEEAALLEPVSVAVHMTEVAGIVPGRSVAISGGGTIGLLALQLALKAGASRVMVSEPVAEKRALAERLGADLTADPLSEDVVARGRELTEGRGFDSVIEASGNLRAAETALALVDSCGTVVWGGVYPDDAFVPVRPFQLYQQELTLRSVYCSPYAFPRSVSLLPKLTLKPLISGVHPLEDLAGVLEHHRTSGAIKTLIQPGA
jgi:(R,R)-butanediol dehydrogenase/meso-butanediol dehydrogenase/diacetyl reductase/L-iditol 2-dehydrogenase